MKIIRLNEVNSTQSYLKDNLPKWNLLNRIEAIKNTYITMQPKIYFPTPTEHIQSLISAGLTDLSGYYATIIKIARKIEEAGGSIS